MGYFSSKIGATLLVGTVSLGSLGLYFTGSETLQDATKYVKDAGNRLVQFENNEEALLNKIGTVKEDANIVIDGKNVSIKSLEGDVTRLQGTISDLEGQKGQLEKDIEGLSAQIVTLQSSLDKETADHEATQGQLDRVTADRDAKAKELKTAKDTIVKLNNLIVWAEGKAKEADKVVAELEGEVLKANAEVETHGEVVDEVEGQTVDSVPMTQEEIDAIDTTINK